MLLSLFRVMAATVWFLYIRCYSCHIMLVDMLLVYRVGRWLQQTLCSHLMKLDCTMPIK